MHIITEKRIWQAKEQWPRSATALDAWYRLAKACRPRDFAALKATFPAIDKVGALHVFDIGGNKLRLIAVVHYTSQRLYIKQVLDHTEYDRGRWKE
jgi:mRNA interferase HigB